MHEKHFHVYFLFSCYRVCKRWNSLAKSSQFWRTVDFKFTDSDKSGNAVAEDLIAGLPRCVSSVSLDFKDVAQNTEPINFRILCEKIKTKCPDIEQLMLTNCELCENVSAVIDSCSYFLENVKNLVFNWCVFPHDETVPENGCISKIQSLDLSYCDIEGKNKPKFTSMPFLQALVLREGNFAGNWFDISVLTQLTLLHVGESLIDAQTVSSILNNAVNIQHLYLCNVDLSNNDFTAVKSPNLTTICLADTNITVDDIVLLIQSCASLEQVYINTKDYKLFVENSFFVENQSKLQVIKRVPFGHTHLIGIFNY